MAAAATDLLQKVSIATATTLDAPGYTIGDPSITVASTSTWPTDTGITFAIDEVDANGDRVANSYNEYVGTVASGTSVTNVSHVNGTDRNYSAGVTTRVYIPVSEERENRIVTWGLVEHSQAGVHALTSNSTLTSSKIITGMNDTNGNELFKVTATGSAVNEFTIANAATGNNPTLSATGGDTNIGLTISPKGTGTVNIPGLKFSGARVKRATQQTGVLASTLTTIAWTGEDFDTDVYHDNSTNNSRMTIPSGLGGYFDLGCHVEFDAWDNTATAYRLIIELWVNNSLVKQCLDMAIVNNGGETAIGVTDVRQLSAADYVEWKVYQATPNTRALTTNTHAWIERRGI